MGTPEGTRDSVTMEVQCRWKETGNSGRTYLYPRGFGQGNITVKPPILGFGDRDATRVVFGPVVRLKETGVHDD